MTEVGRLVEEERRQAPVRENVGVGHFDCEPAIRREPLANVPQLLDWIVKMFENMREVDDVERRAVELVVLQPARLALDAEERAQRTEHAGVGFDHLDH